MKQAGTGTSLGDIAGGILDAQLPEGVPILARRRGPEKRLAEAKAEEREQLAVAHAKKALKGQAHEALKSTSTSDLVLETMLRKTATKGVVSLFNAVRTAQKDRPDASGGGEAQAGKRRRIAQQQGAAEGAESGGTAGWGAATDMSKDSFLDILRRGTGKAGGAGRQATAGGSESAASFLRDDFMLGRQRAKDWGRAEEGDEDDEEDGVGAADIDDDDDDML